MSRKSTIDVLASAGSDILAANTAAADAAASSEAREPRVILHAAVGNVSLTKARTGNLQLSIGLQVNAQTAHVYLSLTDSAFPFTVAKLERAWDASAPDALFEGDSDRTRVEGIVEWLKPLTKPLDIECFRLDDGSYELPWGRKHEVLF